MNEQVLEGSQAPRAPRVVDLTVLIPVSERGDAVDTVFEGHVEHLDALDVSYEVVFVVDGPNDEILDKLRGVRSRFPNVQVITLNRWFGEATALAVGFEHSHGRTILTLPSYLQVNPEDIGRMYREFLDADSDLAIAWRHPRVDSRINRLQSWAFRTLTRAVTDTRFHDISCGVRFMRREVAEEIPLYGDLHRFYPLLAYQRGFRIIEVKVRQSRSDVQRRVYRPGLYIRRMLDLLTLFFLLKFTKKPLRFFGLIGSGVFALGSAITLYLGVYRLLGMGPIAGRPLLILGVLFIVLGLQLFSLGLLGEIIIYTHARHMRDYSFRDLED